MNPEYRTTISVVYFFLQIFGGHLGIPVILLTFFLKKDLRKHPLLINFLVTWVLYSSSFCLLWAYHSLMFSPSLRTRDLIPAMWPWNWRLYVGYQFGPEPPVDLCLSQASLIYGTAVMVSMAGLAFVINVCPSLMLSHLSPFPGLLLIYLLYRFGLVWTHWVCPDPNSEPASGEIISWVLSCQLPRISPNVSAQTNVMLLSAPCRSLCFVCRFYRCHGCSKSVLSWALTYSYLEDGHIFRSDPHTQMSPSSLAADTSSTAL